MSNNEKDVYEVVDADSSSQPKIGNIAEESPSRSTNSVMHSPTQQRPVSRGLVRPPAGASLLRNYSKRPSDATRIAKPQPRHLISPFSPLNTLDRSIGGIVSKAKRATKSVANSTGFHNFDSGRKRKHEEMKPRGGTAAAGAGRQVKKEGPIQLDSEDEEASPPKNKQSKETGEEEYSVPVRIAYEDRVVNAPKTPTPKKAVATPPSKINKNFRAVEFEIENLVFGLSGKYSNAPDLRFQLMITPKRSESIVHILQAHKEIPDMTFRHDEIDRINYCLDSLDIAIKLCVRKTSTHFETSADTVLFKIKIPETATSMANYAIKNIEDLSEVFKTKDLRPDEMERFRRTPRPSRRRSLVDDREEQQQSGPTKSPYFAGDGEKTGDQKGPAESKQLKKYGSSTRKLIDDDLSSFEFPKGWEKPSISSTRVTRRSSGALKVSTWATDLANYDLSEDTAMSTRSQPTRKKLVMGEPPLDYRFGNKTTVVSQDDFSRLDDGEFLNDTILDFYLKYTIAQLEICKPDVAKATFVFNSFFYKKLTERVNGGKGGFESVKKWTTKVDIFSMKYVVIPINEKAHWYVAILCNLDKLVDGASKKAEAEEAGSVSEDVRSDSVEVDVVDIDLPTSRSGIKRSLSSTIKKAKVAPSSADEPTIYVLDSLGLRHNTIFRPLRDYLVAEAKDKRGLTIDRDDIKSKHGFAPTQPNYCDCGVYVAHYVETFLAKPDAFLQLWVDNVNPKKTVESQLLKLFDVDKLNNKREYIQRLILRLRREVTGVGTSPSPEPTEAEKSAAKAEVEEEVKEVERSGDAEEKKSGKEDIREIEEITQDDKETTTVKGDEESTSGPAVSNDAAHDVEAHDVDEDKLTTERQDTETGTETETNVEATEDAPNKDRSEDHEAMSIDSDAAAEEADKIIEAVENASRMEVEEVDVDAAPLEESLLDSSTTEDGEGR